MKKTLIALAVLAASTASMAQVTLYGVADVAVGASDKTNAASGSNYGLATTQFQALANGSLTNGNSRFGLKGSEDLAQLPPIDLVDLYWMESEYSYVEALSKGGRNHQ